VALVPRRHSRGDVRGFADGRDLGALRVDEVADDHAAVVETDVERQRQAEMFGQIRVEDRHALLHAQCGAHGVRAFRFRVDTFEAEERDDRRAVVAADAAAVRCRFSSSPPMIFSATGRSSTESCARHTSPMTPAPIWSSSVYLPSVRET
jgi:hypothetical protein